MSNKAIFLDRDGTIIEDSGYTNHPDQVKLLDGVAEALVDLKALEYKLIVVSNQSGVARGIVTEQALGEIHNQLKQLLAIKGVNLDGIYYCPYHPDGIVAKYRKESELRKPNPGMLLTAAKEMDIDLKKSWTIGNSNRDIEAGYRAGCKTILINQSPSYIQPSFDETSPDYKAVNMKEAANIIKKHCRSHENAVFETQSTKPKQSNANPQNQGPKKNISGQTNEQLLIRILEQLKKMHRSEMFGEFSTMRLLAAVVQIIVLFCLLLSIWFLLSPDREDKAVFIALGFALILQMMSLTFYLMHDRK
jgi:D,D-heptose 1,7-bisphosphate phosphatase